MRELLEALLNRQPRIAVRINASGGGPRLRHFCRGIGAEYCSRHSDNERDDGNDTNGAQRSSKTAASVKGIRRYAAIRTDWNFLTRCFAFEANHVQSVHVRRAYAFVVAGDKPLSQKGLAIPQIGGPRIFGRMLRGAFASRSLQTDGEIGSR